MAYQAYISIKGQKQGQFKGESRKKGREEFCEIIAFDMGTTVPYDANSGLASGHRQHKPVVITKERGAATPQILQACWTNENLPTIIIELVGRSLDGTKEVVVEKITLTNAVVSHTRRYTMSQAKAAVQNDVDHVDEIGFHFQKIEIECTASKTMASDDWQSPNV